MFNDFNKYAKCDSQLYNLTFEIAIVKKNKSFDEFYTRFSTTIAPIGYSETYKISTLKRLITYKLRIQILDDTVLTSYRQFVKRLRRINQNIRQLKEEQVSYQINDDLKEIDSKEFARSNGEKTPSTHSYRENEAINIRYPANFKARLVEKGRYLKCLRRNYRPNYDAPCVKEKSLSYKKAKALLAKEAKIKENAVEKD